MSSITIAGAQIDLDPDLVAILDAIAGRRDMVASLMRAGLESDRPVKGLSWTVGQLNAHLAATAEGYAAMAEGQVVMIESATDRRAVIDRGIARFAEEPGPVLAAVVESGLDRVLGALRDRGDDELVPYYGMDVPPSLVAGMLLNELVVHGVDLARTHHRPLDVPDGAAYQSLLASCTLTSMVLTPWARARTIVYGYAARDHAPIIIALDRGEVTVSHRSARTVDAWFGGSAADLLLATYHRHSVLRSMRTLRLRGRRPHLALLTTKAFEPA
jgi:uncharacterized protein (TIGR03083 family)